jgi:hypothetical protein
MENQTNDRVKIVLDYYNLGFNDIDRKLGLCRNTTRNVVLGVKEYVQNHLMIIS